MRLNGIPAAAVVVVLSALAGGVFGARTVVDAGPRRRARTASTPRRWPRSRASTSSRSSADAARVRVDRRHAADARPALELPRPRATTRGCASSRRAATSASASHRLGRRRDHGDCRCSKGRRPIAPASAATTSSRASVSAGPGRRPNVAWEETKGWETEDVVKRVRGPEGHDRRDLDSPARRRHADRSDRRARPDQDHHRADGVHDRAGHRLRAAAGLLRNDRRRAGRGARRS